MTFFKRLNNDKSNMTAYRSKSDKTLFGLFNMDFWRGKRDGKKSPLAGQTSVDLIQSEEQLNRNETRSAIHQNIGDRMSRLSHNELKQKDNQQQISDLEAVGGLIPEPVAQSLYSSAWRMMVLSVVLMIVEVCGLFSVAKSTFGNGFMSALAVAFLLSTSIAIGVHLILSKVSPERSSTLRMALIVTGCLLSVTGLVGFVLLRAETFTGSITGGQMDFQQIGLGNMLLMAGLTLGVPLLAGSLFDDAMNKFHKSRNSLNLYGEKNRLLNEQGELNTRVKRLDEFDHKLDPICDRIIASRQGRYIRGFHRGASGNPDAVSKLKCSGSLAP